MLSKHFPFHEQGNMLSSDFQQTGLSGQIFVKGAISNFSYIRPVGTELLYADRRTDMTRLASLHRSYANAHKN